MEKPQNERATLTVSEAARILGISRGLCYQMVRQGKLPTLTFGKRILVCRVALERMLEGGGTIADQNGAQS